MQQMDEIPGLKAGDGLPKREPAPQGPLTARQTGGAPAAFGEERNTNFTLLAWEHRS